MADGTTDCAPAIQRTIQEAERAGGGTVVFPAAPKPYRIGRTLKVTSSKITLSGEGATLQQADDVVKSSADHLLWIKGTPEKPLEEIVVRGLALDGNVFNQPRRQISHMPRALFVEHARNVLFDRVRVTRAWVSIALSTGTAEAEVRDCTVTDWHNDAFETGNGSRNIRFVRCRASDARHEKNGGSPGFRDGAWEIEDGTENVTLEDCVVENADGTAFHVKNHNRPAFNRNVSFLRCEARAPSTLGFWIQGLDFDSNASGIVLKDCRSPLSGKDRAIQCDGGVDQVEIAGGKFGTVLLKNPRAVRIVRAEVETLRVQAEKYNDGKNEITPRIVVEDSEIKDPIAIQGDATTVSVIKIGK